MNSCEVCQLPVLELDGQFENLEAYYAEADDPAAGLVGECHSSCIANSEYGRTWSRWRISGYSSSRGYRIMAEREGWSILVHQRHREFLAFHASGISVGGERRSSPNVKKNADKEIDGGLLIPVDEEFNLQLDDVSVANELKLRLRSEGEYPIGELLSAIGIADRVRWPQALSDAVLVHDTQLEREWTSTGVAVRARYAKFLPAPVVPFWKGLQTG